MKSLGLLLAILFTFLQGVRADEAFPKVTVKDGKFYAGDEELLVVSVGYTHLRPGQDHNDPVPYKDHGYDLIDLDMQRIKEAGFNAIRTWHLSDEKYLELAKKHGLWVVGGIWTQTSIDASDEGAEEQAISMVTALSKSYAKSPNTALLLLLNEPDIGRLMSQDPAKVKRYFDHLAAAAHEHCPGVPVGFSNWPNAAFIDSSSWDFVGCNMYAWASSVFQKPIGFRGYIEGIIKRKCGNKPFYLTEFGYWTPVPQLNPKDHWSMTYVPTEQEQARRLVRDIETVYQIKLTGGALLSWADHWAISGEFSSPGIPKPAGYPNKDIHDLETVEWSGLLAYDKDVKGIPRPAYYEVQKANKAIMTEPDSQTIYRESIPISVHLTEDVQRVELTVNGSEAYSFPKTSPHWFRHRLAVPGDKLQRREIVLRVLDENGKTLSEVKREAWAAAQNKLPTLEITHLKDDANRVFFIFRLTDATRKPIPDAEIQWGVLDGAGWQEKGGVLKTDKNGACQLKRPLPANFLLISGGYDYKRDGFQRKITDLYLYKQ